MHKPLAKRFRKRATKGGRGTPRRLSQDQSGESLWQSAECFKLLVESVQDYAIYILDPEGRIATWNIGACRLKGYEASEIIGEHISRFFSEADVRDRKWEREFAVAAQDGRFEDEGFRVRKDGSQFCAHVVLTALRDRSGKLIGFAKVTCDLTARRNAEQMQLEIISRQREVISTLSTPIIEVWHKVLMVPMLGIIDSARAANLTEILLAEIHKSSARFAILDLTGVDAVDTGTAAHLLKIIDAIRLLGAEGIIVGVRPPVAQTMAALRVDMKLTKMLANLREALKHCMKQLAELPA